MTSTVLETGALASSDPPQADTASDAGDVLLLDADVERELPVFTRLLQPAGYRVRAVASIAKARHLVAQSRPVAGLLRLRPDAPPPIEALEALLAEQPSLRIIAVVESRAETKHQLAALLQRDLIYDFHTLPLDPDRLLFILGHIAGLARVEQVAPGSKAIPSQAAEMVGTSTGVRAVAEAIRKVARARAPVLIRGESGTGKELVARAIHQESDRAKGPFVAVNCAGLPPSLIGSELFGHEKGAFTGAIARKIGRIEAARGGTLFLDEIGDLPLELQGHFLRFLQEGTIERIGGSGPIEIDVRVLAATHVDLARAKAEGRFRDDLFYRLDVLSIDLPPLRERGADIELLARHFLDRFARELGRPLVGFRAGALRALRAYSWPGNVRELLSCVHRAAVMAEGKWVTEDDLGLDPARDKTRGRRPTLHEARADLEKRLIQEALEQSGQTVQAAARQLGVSRMTLYRLLDRYGISLERSPEPARDEDDAS